MGTEVLIVEDQVLIAIHLQDLVEEAGYRVAAIAHDAAGALAEVAQQRPAFAIMDIRLANGGSGVEVARQLYLEYGVRCLFISANINDEVRARVAELQPLGFIGKPFLAAEVIGAVQAAALATAR
ncbi:response regulator [Steroidobacter sp. S1-65]|uniref:Response regulator n=1 Tax=Steroidobacter gossypii TaxID=2805490 RepID=A0ABS1X2J9_9GAMM|nr:response regulator [Steroidobacter gossypii]MBM0107445.1 response regulator [Steroidobacter gossypii]